MSASSRVNLSAVWMEDTDRRVAREAAVLTRRGIIEKAGQGRITWSQAAGILGITARQLRRVRKRYRAQGEDGLADQRRGRPRKKRIAEGTAERMFELKRGKYADFSAKHFYVVAVEGHDLKASYGCELPNS